MTSIENNIQKISSLIGAENVIQDQESLHFYSTDIFGTSKEQAIAVVPVSYTHLTLPTTPYV